MNPILYKLMSGNQSSILSAIAQAKQLVNGGNPEQVAANMMQSNPQFRQFMEANKGKSPEQIAQAYGIDLNQVRSLIS